MNGKELCLRILCAESEQAVSDIIDDVPELSDPANWRPIDGRETNFNVVTNQASTGSKALTELCTNMVDAVLLKHAHLKGIEPTGPDAPKSVTDAVRDLVTLRGARSGVLAEVDDEKYLQEFAEENLVIGVTGSTRRGEALCFTFVDNGEGQRAEDFEDTFLSLSKGNKSNIPFVQGKYNMGSSGVLTYCGNRWYKLIVSRRYDGASDWGWTLVRRRPGGGTPIAEYFKPSDGIPSFASADLRPIHFQSGPNQGQEDDKVSINTGTVVKLYEYQMESASDFRYVRESLNQNLVTTALPFRLMDYTVRPQRTGRRAQGVDERSLYGMEFILLHWYGEAVSRTQDGETLAEPGREHHVGEIENPDLGRISVRAIVLRKELPGWLHYRRNTARVFHTVNGQVQFTENRAYLSQNCKLPGLKDRIIVIVDASNLSEEAHNDVWKGDREKIRATNVEKLYRDQVTGVIESSTFLKDLQRQLAREETEQIAEQSRVDLFQSLVENDPSIAQLLPGGTLVKLPGGIGRNKEDAEEWQGKYSPTFLELVGRRNRTNGAEIVVDGARVVNFRTDAANDYFTRPDNRGRIAILPTLSDKFSRTHTLRDGQLAVKFQALENRVQPGEEILCYVGLQDDAMHDAVSAELRLQVVETRKITSGSDNRDKTGGDEPNGDAVTEQRALPPSKWLTRDGRAIGEDETEAWPADFTDQDGGQVEDLGEGTRLYYVNYDNAHFRRVLDGQRNDIDKKVVAAQYRMGMLVTMLGLEDAYERMTHDHTKAELEEHIDDIRRLAAQGAATVMMSIAKTLPAIVNPATVSDPDD